MDIGQELRRYIEWREEPKRRLFTPCVEFAYWYEFRANIDTSGTGMPEVEKSYRAMIAPIRDRVNCFSAKEADIQKKLKRDTYDLFPFSLRGCTKENWYGTGINQVTLLQSMTNDFGYRDRSDIFFDAHLTEFSYQRMGLSIEEVLANPQAFVQLCIAGMAGVKFRSGHAGLSFNYDDTFINSYTHLQDPVVGRYRGVNVVHPWRYRKLDGVPTVNWLTLVSSEDIERLGGWQVLAQQVKDPVVLHRLPHGALLQAGPSPQLGYVNAQERLEAYHAVGAVLAPVKSTIELQSSAGGGRAEANEWAHRFFRPCPF
jgi:hypothetical protein